jgi:micrococcal nuclease
MLKFAGKRDFILAASFFLNVILIFVLITQVRSPDNELPGKTIVPTQSGNFEQVIGETSVGEGQTVRVIKVVDGDTIKLENDQTVRYIGIDTPEVSQGKECYADEATNRNKELVLGKVVRLVKDVSETDRYGRLLRYVYTGDVFINETLVFEGYATAVTYPPDVKYSELFREAERQARQYNRGLWGSCGDENNSSPKQSQVIAPTPYNSPLTTTNFNCSSNSYNCADFKTQTEAQKVFDICWGASNDVHKLDSDGDGIACEGLP